MNFIKVTPLSFMSYSQIQRSKDIIRSSLQAIYKTSHTVIPFAVYRKGDLESIPEENRLELKKLLSRFFIIDCPEYWDYGKWEVFPVLKRLSKIIDFDCTISIDQDLVLYNNFYNTLYDIMIPGYSAYIFKHAMGQFYRSIDYKFTDKTNKVKFYCTNIAFSNRLLNELPDDLGYYKNIAPVIKWLKPQGIFTISPRHLVCSGLNV